MVTREIEHLPIPSGAVAVVTANVAPVRFTSPAAA